jgi:hypothetical protein
VEFGAQLPGLGQCKMEYNFLEFGKTSLILPESRASVENRPCRLGKKIK